MFDVRTTEIFDEWLASLRDKTASDAILRRIRRFELGNMGDIKFIGSDVSEARIHFGPGYRLYFVRRGELIIVLLCGGTKRGQSGDISRAMRIAQEV
jgi:putative addiction module killer protein